MKRALTLVVIGVCVAAGCSEFFQNPNPQPSGEAGLKRFNSQDELVNYFRGEITTRNDSLANENRQLANNTSVPEADSSGAGGQAPSAAPSGSDSVALTDDGGGSYSTTTIQEAGVDEADVVKTDGRNFYLIDDTGEHAKLRIVSAVPANQMTVLGEIDLEGYGRELYLHNGTIVAVTATSGIVFFGEPGIDILVGEREGATPTDEVDSPDGTKPEAGTTGGETPDGSTSQPDLVSVDASEPVSSDDTVNIAPVDLILPGSYTYERPRLIVTVVDVSNPAAPQVQSATKFDGSVSASRMIAGKLHLVLSNYQNYYFDVMPRLGFADFSATEVDPATLIPKYERTNADGSKESGDVLTYADLYYPTEPDGFGVVAVVSMDVDNDADFRATGVVSEPGIIYSSVDALYLANTDYDFLGNMRTSTDIYKFAYQDGRAVPVSAGRVPGRLLNQYSLGEFNGILRVATTVDPTFGAEGQITAADNNVYCLGDSDGKLSVMGSIEGIAPRETIQSCRFVGDRGYVVTFEQIDPLFTLDLADPTNPQIIGELKVPGFSTFIVPMDANHLLTIGQYIPEDGFRSWGVQLSIFDVTDFAKPVLSHSVVLGGEGGAWSEALYDPKAFTYFSEQGLLALPITVYPVYPIFIDPIAVDGDADVRPEVTDAGGGSDASGSSGSSAGIAVGEPSPIDQGFEGLVVYRVSATEGFTELGQISTRFDQPGFYSWTSFTRGVFIDQTVYAVTNQGTRAASVSDVATIVDDIFYGTQYPIEISPLPVEPDFPENEPFVGEDMAPAGSAVPAGENLVGPPIKK